MVWLIRYDSSACPLQPRAPRTMCARHAVLFNAPTVDPRPPRFAQFLCNVNPFRINTYKTVSKQATLSTFRINTYEKQAGWGRVHFLLPRISHLPQDSSSFLSYSCALFCTLQKLNPFVFKQFRTHCEKPPGVGGTLPSPRNVMFARSLIGRSLRTGLDVSSTGHGSRVTAHRLAFSLPRYLLTSLPLGALRAPLATLFHPWLANASANTSLPISTGAKRLRAPSASRRTPRFRCRGTTNIAGSKLVQDTVK